MQSLLKQIYSFVQVFQNLRLVEIVKIYSANSNMDFIIVTKENRNTRNKKRFIFFEE